VNPAALDYGALADARLVALARRGDGGAFGAIMQRCNGRLFRIARGILGDEAEAEDVLQEAYVRAYAALPGFRGDASLLTWLTAIVVNEARTRLRRRRPQVELRVVDEAPERTTRPSADAGPEAAAARSEARRLLEHAIDALPPDFRSVFVLREVEGCSVAETAAGLELSPVTVRTRLHRARALLRRQLEGVLAEALSDAFPFGGARCAAFTGRVLESLGLAASAPLPSYGRPAPRP
jgi:RNA polymerase sigma-70 factor (ECF subfamily)